MSVDWSPSDPIAELRFAFVEADDLPAADAFRTRVLANAAAEREPGISVLAIDRISGAETLRRQATRLDELLKGLDRGEWAAHSVRGLDIQGLVGHLIGVERSFAATLEGDFAASRADHVESTQSTAMLQAGCSPADTLQEWQTAVRRTLTQLEGDADPARLIEFHRIGLALDDLLVVRSFELWTHEEDIRRSTGRPLRGPDPETLDRMTDLATRLLPTGMARAGRSAERQVRLVLTGAGGGSWDVPLHGGEVTRARPGAVPDSHAVVGAAEFCRVVANRADLAGSGALVTGDADAAEVLFAGAAALALD